MVEPTHHQETLRLAMKFNELTDLEANYQLNHYEFISGKKSKE